jgi:hypothetical protein
VGAGAFYALSRSRARSKKEREEKSANSRFFLPPTLEARFQRQKMFDWGKSKGLEYDVQYRMLKYDYYFS